MINPDVAMSYLHYVSERHKVWERRRIGPGPWTDDPILQSYKFTNDFRVLDHGSQFLVRELLDPDIGPLDTLARCFLYRYTNEPLTWLYMRDVILTRYPLASDLNTRLVKGIQRYRDKGNRVFSGAYVILPQPGRTGDKVQQAVELTARWMHQYGDRFLAATNQGQRWQLLVAEYGVGKFMGMQILTDWGYSVYGGDRENGFVVPGPGCAKGAKYIAPEDPVMETLDWAINAVHQLPDCPMLALPDGRQRPPSWMDVQNTLCEFSKYHRHAAKPPRALAYSPAHPGPQPDPVLPSHW